MEEENDMKQAQQQQQNQKIENDGNSRVKRSSTRRERCIAICGRFLFYSIMLVVVGITFDAFIAYFHGYADSIIHTADLDMTSKGEMDFTFALDTESWFQSHLHTLHVDGMECDLSMKIQKWNHRNLKRDSSNNSNEILEYYEEAHVAHLSLLQSVDLRPRSIWTDIIRIVNSADVKTKDKPEDAGGVSGTTSHFLRGSASKSTSTASSSASSSSSTTSSSSSPMSSTSSRQQVADNHKVTTKMGITHFQFSSFATLLSTLTQHNPTSGGIRNPIGVARCVVNGRVDIYSMGQWGVQLQDYPVYQQRSVNLTHIMNYNPNPNYNNDVVLSKSGQSNASSSYPWLAHTLVHTLLSPTDHLSINYISNSNALPTKVLPTNHKSNSDFLSIIPASSNNPLVANTLSNSISLPTSPLPINALPTNHLLSITAQPTSTPTSTPTSQPTSQPTNRLETTHPSSYLNT